MVENSVLIVDASVALKWFFTDQEDDLESALAIKGAYLKHETSILVPVHFFVEFANTVFRKHPNFAVTLLSELQNLRIPFIALSLEIASISEILMKKYPKISFYDAFYHALAIEKKGTFVTADEQYYKMVKKEGHILLLKDYV